MPAKKIQAAETEEIKTPKVLTNYKALVNAKIVPVGARCESNWRFFHNQNQGCHTAIDLRTDRVGENLIKHLEAGHSGGFLVRFRPVREGVWAGWKTLIDEGIEIANFNCMVCNQDVLLHPQHIAKHMKRHLNGNKRMQKGGSFRIAFTKDAPLPTDELGLLPKEDFDFMDGEWEDE